MYKTEEAGRPRFKKPPVLKMQVREDIARQLEPMTRSELTWFDGKMNSAEFALAIEKLGLTPSDVGQWLGMSQRTGHRLVAGDVPISTAIGKLVTLMVRLKLKPDQV
jgi:predicted transcriptional regulator